MTNTRSGLLNLVAMTVSLMAFCGIGAAQTQIFQDVTTDSPYYTATAVLYQDNITAGCSASPLMFCPNDNLLRYQLAIFLVRAWSIRMWGDPEAFNTNDPPSATPYFTDVQPGDAGFPYIQKLKELNITAGCSTSAFCPNDMVQNYQTAILSIRTRYLTDQGCVSTSNCNPDGFAYGQTQKFTDVGATDAYYKWIQDAVDLGIVSNTMQSFTVTGEQCALGSFCELNHTPRGAAAIYIQVGVLAGQLPMQSMSALRSRH